jgi:ribosomal protein S6--L-glutamate ligase
MRIGFLMQRYAPGARSHLPAAARLLADRGVTVEPLYLAERLIDIGELRVEHDLYVLKDKSPLAMSVAAALHAAGAAIANPYPASAMLRDKIVAFHVLRAAGVPTPQTFVATRLEQLRPALEAGPLVVKPYRGSRGVGVRIVRDAAELAALPPTDDPVFAQRYHAPAGRDRKVYAIGDEFHGVMRVWPPRTLEDKLGEPFEPSREEAEIARRCGAAFGIDLFGVDIVESDGTPYVVDMSSLPGFKGVPDAVRRLAEYLYAAAERATHGEPLVPAGVPDWAAKGSALDLVLQALFTKPATPAELEQIRRLLEETPGR